MQIALAILQALIALPKIGKLIQEAFTSFLAWYKNMEKEKLRKQIESAAFQTKQAKTKGERRNAARRWQDIISG